MRQRKIRSNPTFFLFVCPLCSRVFWNYPKKPAVCLHRCFAVQAYCFYKLEYATPESLCSLFNVLAQAVLSCWCRRHQCCQCQTFQTVAWKQRGFQEVLGQLLPQRSREFPECTKVFQLNIGQPQGYPVSRCFQTPGWVKITRTSTRNNSWSHWRPIFAKPT